ncbi:GPI transamidase component [Coemansia sp. RSA 989]|nr:GPI transamidase component [Coemansia sp. RSA 1821]KAJ1860438.1 GPI transamidase component [Coemansia sp. RSA 989]KAJ1868664.1 GPI transamidase component [Coemansia sp. RSA 990]KAJ2645790.1 GPI transamidase component [Coemansia sp. RSA 1250]KAJ2669025.1 GPI transamidase component [Coemansia sp. RSA 1085]
MSLIARLRALLQRGGEPKTVISVHRERQVAVFSILLVLLLGLPLWWTTTRVYRAELPAAEISQFSPQTTFAVPVKFYISAETLLSPAEIASIEQSVQSRVDAQRKPHAAGEWRVRYRVSVHSGSAPDAPGHYTLRLRTGGKASAIDVGPGRSATVSVTQPSIKPALVEAISAMVADEELRASAVGKTGKHAALKYAPEYAVTLTLLNENPVDGAVVDWDIEQAVSEFLQPFVDELRPLARLSVTTQVLHHAGPPPVSMIQKNNATYLTHDMLPHFVNSPSWNFASIDPVSPMLNFVLFVPALASQPVYILGDQASDAEKSAFLVSQWGGVSIANLPKTTRPGDKVVLSLHELQQHFGYFISQLRSLVGIRSQIFQATTLSTIRVQPATSTGVSGWELDALMRRWLIYNRQTAISTLQSLIRLVNSLENMVVMDEIKLKVDKALAALYEIDQALSLPHDYLSAFSSAAKAASFAESAFFDPSMVSMLYFPDQHKYAIYMPFFLPITMPLVAAVKKILAERRRRKQTDNESKQD